MRRQAGWNRQALHCETSTRGVCSGLSCRVPAQATACASLHACPALPAGPASQQQPRITANLGVHDSTERACNAEGGWPRAAHLN